MTTKKMPSHCVIPIKIRVRQPNGSVKTQMVNVTIKLSRLLTAKPATTKLTKKTAIKAAVKPAAKKTVAKPTKPAAKKTVAKPTKPTKESVDELNQPSNPA